jgi:PAS domain S-box-containing protein
MRITATVFGLTGAFVVGSTFLTYRAGDRVLKLHQQEEERRHAILALDDLFSTLQDAETGQRGFIITGDETYLEPFQSAQARLPETIKRFANSPQSGITETDRNALDEAIRQEIGELTQTIEMRRSKGFEAVLPVIRADNGKKFMDRIREMVGRLREEQQAELTKDIRESNVATRHRTDTFLATAALNVLVLLWGFLRIRRALRERNDALLERQQQSDLLSTTLASIGDCVMVTDPAGRITFMNQVAADVTGWEAKDASGRSVKEVFKIINEHTRQPVEDPVEKVIKHGVIVGLANHTLLIRKDGSEVPIDDSGAPIRTPEGKLEGVVLVFRDFSEHKKIERELRAAKEAAESASKAKDQFLAMLSHELRTPLTPVLATLQLWEMRADSLPPRLHSDVKMLRHNVELEARIIDDLLDLTRIARGLLSLSEEEIDVHSIIKLPLDIICSDANAKEIKVVLQPDATRHFVHCDAVRFQQVLWNVLRNAVNFTDRKGNITIRTNNYADQIRISIEDSGVGMSSETLAKLFTPFEQADRNRSVRYGGLGLGLAISHALIKQMGGELTAESQGVGKGSKFVISLKAQNLASTTGSRPTAAVPTRGKKRILLVEDHADTAAALTRLLQARGHAIRRVSSAAEALLVFKPDAFDLIICDIGLPDGNGYDLLNSIRQIDSVAAVALTGFGMTTDIAQAKEAGFDAHLTKPVDFYKLESVIAQLSMASSNRS